MGDADERRRLGAEKVGKPAGDVMDAIARLSTMEEYRRLRYDAIQFYGERFLCRELMALIDESWDMERLSAVNPDVVKVAFIMLLRDMMQTHRDKIVIDPDDQKWDTQWIEHFVAALFFEAKAPMQPYQSWLSVVQSQGKEDSAMLSLGLAKQLSLDPSTLYQAQTAACQVTLEETLG